MYEKYHLPYTAMPCSCIGVKKSLLVLQESTKALIMDTHRGLDCVSNYHVRWSPIYNSYKKQIISDLPVLLIFTTVSSFTFL